MIQKLTNMKPWQTQEKKRSEAHEKLKNGKKILLLNDEPGTGKSIWCFIKSCEKNRETLVLTNNHELAIQFYRNWMTYTDNYSIGYMVARNRLLNEDEKEIISYVTGRNITQDYACTRCADDEEFREFVTKGYLIPNMCKHCDYRDNGECIYFLLKEHLYSKLDSIDDNRLTLLVKPYIYTGFVKETLKKLLIESTIFDEGFLNLTYATLSYTNIKVVNSYIKFIDYFIAIINRREQKFHNLSPEDKEANPIMFTYNNIVRIWFPIKKIIKLFINNDKSNHTARQKKTSIYNILIEFKKKFGKKEVEVWYENLKEWLHIEHLRTGFKYIPPNKFSTLESILEDIYKISDDELKHRLIVNKDNMIFTYVADTREKISEIINYKNNKTLIPSAALTKQMFEIILPEFKENYIEQRDNELKSLFKAINIYTSGAYPKYILYNELTGEFTEQYYNLLEVLKKLILRHRNKKILIGAFKIIKEELKLDLKYFLEEYNINKENIAFEHYFNIAGLNKYENFNVGILFGACGLPKDMITILSKFWHVDKKILKRFYIEMPMYQFMERLRSIMDPYNKIIYQLSNIKCEKYPTEQILYFNKVVEYAYKEFMEKLEEAGACNTKECLIIYNKCNYNKIETPQQMYSILKELYEQHFVNKEPIKIGNYRPVFYYNVIKNT